MIKGFTTYNRRGNRHRIPLRSFHVGTAFDATLLPFRDTFGQCDRLFPHRLLLEYSRNL